VSREAQNNTGKEERRENALRPCPYLGYDRDELGMYLLSRGAFEIAESLFRRAVWLNPYEYRFVMHLAWCLYKQRHYKEAKQAFGQIDTTCMETDEEARRVGDLINPGFPK